MIFLPIINAFLCRLSFFGFLLFLFIANFFLYGLGYYFSVNYYYLYETLLFYSCGAFFKLYLSQKNFNKFLSIILIILCYLGAMYLSKIFFLANLNKSLGIAKLANSVLRTCFIPIIGFLLFSLFSSFKVRENKAINLFASKSLEVYLLHGSNFQTYFWSKIFNIKLFYQSNLFCIHLLFSILLIYILSTLVGIFNDKYYFIYK